MYGSKKMKDTRNIIEEREKSFFSPFSSLSSSTKGRKTFEEPDPLRTEFMRDRDRIIHSESFRRLKHKTQVFLSPSNDSFRTRLTHTLEVSQIARTISKALCLNEDLTEAIALGHDVGHTPFGHSGEQVIKEEIFSEFKHSDQSVRVLEKLEKAGKGLNLTEEVLDGIKKHSKTGKTSIIPENDDDYPETIEGEVVRYSDTIAYVNHDVDDAIRSGILEEKDLPSETINYLGKKHSERINTLVLDVINNSMDKKHIFMSENILKVTENFRDFLYDNVYKHPSITNEMDKAKNILYELFKFLSKNMNIVYSKLNAANYIHDKDDKMALVDFLALMTDTEAVNLFFKYFIPKSFYL